MADLDGRPATPAELQTLALVNYGHFTSLRVDDGRVRGLQLHLERLVRDCRIVFGADLDPARARELIRSAVADRSGSLVVRVTVFDPALSLGHPADPATPHLLVTTRETAPAELPPLRVQSRVYQRECAAVKHIGLFGPLYHRRSAQLAGFDDALFTTADGTVSEGGTWNFGLVDAAGAVVWPQAEVLPGTTMALLQRAHPHTTAPVTLADLGTARAAFATNVSIGVRPIAAVDDCRLPADDPVLDQLRTAYEAVPAEEL